MKIIKNLIERYRYHRDAKKFVSLLNQLDVMLMQEGNITTIIEFIPVRNNILSSYNSLNAKDFMHDLIDYLEPYKDDEAYDIVYRNTATDIKRAIMKFLYILYKLATDDDFLYDMLEEDIL